MTKTLSLVVVILAGCSGGSTKSLDCEYLAGENCWKTTAVEATSCLPPDGAMGVLAADNASCTYSTGQTVTFTPALVLPLPQGGKNWNVTVSNAGQECAHFEEEAGGSFSLTVGTDTVGESAAGTTGLDLTCPDGTVYENTNALDLLNCPDASFGDLPGTTSSSSTTSVSLGLINTGSTTAITLFNCSR
ncbi:MAG TPA: hypothetical protein VGM90_14350 [Kofleriaceae bacterium]|jgi:hypothetical protein